MYKDHLARDPVMKSLMDKYGDIDLDYKTNPYEDIIFSIISQQLSDKVATVIAQRFVKLAGGSPINPFRVVSLKDKDIRDVGISFSKISYIKEVSNAVGGGKLDFEALKTMPDEQVIFELTRIKGIGKWTAEMFLIFTLKREDTFSVGDAGLRRAVSNLYYVNANDMPAIEKISLRWKPFRSYASRYLWKSLAD